MLDDVLYIGGIVLAAALVVILVLGFGLLIAWPISHATCVQTSHAMNVDYEFKLLGGCFLDLDGQMIPSKQWSYIRFNVPQVDDGH